MLNYLWRSVLSQTRLIGVVLTASAEGNFFAWQNSCLPLPGWGGGEKEGRLGGDWREWIKFKYLCLARRRNCMPLFISRQVSIFYSNSFYLTKSHVVLSAQNERPIETELHYLSKLFGARQNWGILAGLFS